MQRRKPLIALLAAALACLGAATSITGIISNDKMFYAIAAFCMSFAAIFFWLFSRSNMRLGQ